MGFQNFVGICLFTGLSFQGGLIEIGEQPLHLELLSRLSPGGRASDGLRGPPTEKFPVSGESRRWSRRRRSNPQEMAVSRWGRQRRKNLKSGRTTRRRRNRHFPCYSLLLFRFKPIVPFLELRAPVELKEVPLMAGPRR